MPPDPKPDEEEEAEAPIGEGPADVVGLLALAKAYRTGEAPGGRDMKKCLETYLAAAELGSGDAEYAVALFHLQGGVVAQDLKEGTTRLRAAAEKGSIPARVYLGNMYELGIHYKADPEKADVWYRNAARASKIEAEVGSDEHASELAELGCVRYVLARIEKGELDEEEKKHLLARAKAHGYGLKMRDAPQSDGRNDSRMTLTDALADADAPAPAAKPREAKDTSPATPVAKKKTDKPTPSRAGPAIAAFAWAVVFMTAGVGAAYAASLGAHELVARGHALPGLEKDVRPVFPIVLALVGVLPTWLVYRLDAMIKGIVVGGALGGVGWIAWGTGIGKLHAARPVEALAFGIAGFLAALLVFGLLGGTKAASRPTRR
ncbi:MAG TPA: tetratricopeptide repeat protein [Labilithrix sp.]|jgi:hypothetical protein